MGSTRPFRTRGALRLGCMFALANRLGAQVTVSLRTPFHHDAPGLVVPADGSGGAGEPLASLSRAAASRMRRPPARLAATIAG
jgi:hypothetical protein